MQISRAIPIVAILIIMFTNTNIAIPKELYQINGNNKEIIDDNIIKRDNIHIDSNINREVKDRLVMEENILNNEESQINESTITGRNGYFTVLKESTPILQVKTKNTVTTFESTKGITNAHKITNTRSKDLNNSDLVINYAAIDSDMNIAPIKTNGKIILMITPEVNSQTKLYNMLNITPVNNKTDIDGNGISLTASGERCKDKEITDKMLIHSINGATISIEQSDQTPTGFIEKREHTRFKIADITSPVIMETNNETLNLLDISRGGVAIEYNNNKKPQVGSTMPVRLKYKNIDINTNIKILSTKDSRVGAKFVNDDKSTENKLLYLSILLESDNNMLKTKLSKRNL